MHVPRDCLWALVGLHRPPSLAAHPTIASPAADGRGQLAACWYKRPASNLLQHSLPRFSALHRTLYPLSPPTCPPSRLAPPTCPLALWHFMSALPPLLWIPRPSPFYPQPLSPSFEQKPFHHLFPYSPSSPPLLLKVAPSRTRAEWRSFTMENGERSATTAGDGQTRGSSADSWASAICVDPTLVLFLVRAQARSDHLRLRLRPSSAPCYVPPPSCAFPYLDFPILFLRFLPSLPPSPASAPSSPSVHLRSLRPPPLLPPTSAPSAHLPSLRPFLPPRTSLPPHPSHPALPAPPAHPFAPLDLLSLSPLHVLHPPPSSPPLPRLPPLPPLPLFTLFILLLSLPSPFSTPSHPESIPSSCPCLTLLQGRSGWTTCAAQALRAL